MLSSTVELIILASSNPLIIFCFCNLIILILLISGSKPNSQPDQDGYVCVPKGGKRFHSDEAFLNDDIEASSDTNKALETGEGHVQASVRIPMATNLVEEEDKGGDELLRHDSVETSSVCCQAVEPKRAPGEEADVNNNEDVDDELRRRVEEFINKTNRSWQAEMLQTSSYLKGEKFQAPVSRGLVI